MTLEKLTALTDPFPVLGEQDFLQLSVVLQGTSFTFFKIFTRGKDVTWKHGWKQPGHEEPEQAIVADGAVPVEERMEPKQRNAGVTRDTVDDIAGAGSIPRLKAAVVPADCSRCPVPRHLLCCGRCSRAEKKSSREQTFPEHTEMTV